MRAAGAVGRRRSAADLPLALPTSGPNYLVDRYEDDGTNLGGFNSQMAGEGGFADTTFLCDERVYIHLRKHV